MSTEEILFDEEQCADENGMYEHYRFVADKGQGLLRVDKFLVARMEGTSRNRVQQSAEAGCILAWHMLTAKNNGT